MSQASNEADENNPLVNPGANPPGSQNMEPSSLHPKAVHQTYHTAGGERQLGEEKPEDYDYAKDPKA